MTYGGLANTVVNLIGVFKVSDIFGVSTSYYMFYSLLILHTSTVDTERALLPTIATHPAPKHRV